VGTIFIVTGLIVYTTLNATMQRAADRAVTEHITGYQNKVVDKRWNWGHTKACSFAG